MSKNESNPNALGSVEACNESVPAAGSQSDFDLENLVERALLLGVCGGEVNRRKFLSAVGKTAALGALSSVFPLEEVKALAHEAPGKSEKRKLRVGYVPITCSAPLIAAEPFGFFRKHGLEVEITPTAGWAATRDKCLSGEFDASHLLAPMPLAMSAGVGGKAESFIVPAMQNTNGQALVLAKSHRGRRDPKGWKGFRFAVPFEFSMHNLLLRYYLSEHGLDPDRDVKIQILPPAAMVEHLKTGQVDGYLAPDPYCQRAVYDEVGFIHLLTKDLWPQHPCCAVGCRKGWAQENPRTFLALFRAILESIQYCDRAANRVRVSDAICRRRYLNQPAHVVRQVMTGLYEDGLGSTRYDPDRIHFAPLPMESMAHWILQEMKRWGYLPADADYSGLAREVYLAAGAESFATPSAPERAGATA